MSDLDFTVEQKKYLEGFAAGSGMTQLLPTFASTLGINAQLPAMASGAPAAASTAISSIPTGPEAVHYLAQDRQVAAGKKLVPEELAKRKKFPLDQWNDIKQHAAEGRFPKGTDVLAFKYNGMFYVAPAQDSYMCRLRFAGGICPSFQFRRVAELAEKYGGGFTHVTTRANLQLREIKATDPVHVIEGLHDAGIIHRGSGADNIRNVTGSPTAGIDRQELIDTRPLSRELHHYILNHREMYGLPRKFNIAFDGGGVISAVEDTNDIGFSAVRVGEGKTDSQGKPIEPGVYFRMALGGITGHKDFARDTGVLLKPEECLPAAVAVVRVFTDHGNRSDRRKARLKYVLDDWGHEKFVAETDKRLPAPMRRLPLESCEPRPGIDKLAHIGFHAQRQPGMFYVGVALPVGRLSAEQMRGLSDIAERRGSGCIRLTVWQNLLISDIPEEQIESVKSELQQLGLDWRATAIHAGLVACTGAMGCKFALAHTKENAMQLLEFLEPRLRMDVPVNIHFTGCPNSCAQHYMGDIGLMGTKVEVGDDMVEGYHLFVGGGYGADQAVGREIYRGVLASDVPPTVERMLRAYLDHRTPATETFREFILRQPTEQLLELFDRQAVTS